MTMKQNNESLLALLKLFSVTYDSHDQNGSGVLAKSSNIHDLREQYKIPDAVDDDSYMANSIAGSVLYFGCQENGIMGIAPVMTPLHTAIAWFEIQSNWNEKAQWCRELLKQVPALQADQLYQALKVSNIAMRVGCRHFCLTLEDGATVYDNYQAYL